MQYRDNAAYSYEQGQKNNAARVQPKRETKISRIPQRKSKPKKQTSLVVKIGVCLLMMAAVFFNLNMRAQINDTQTQINKAKTELEALQSEQVSLEMQVQNIISYANLEQEAEKLGMHKVVKSQIHYIDSGAKDSAEVIQNK